MDEIEQKIDVKSLDSLMNPLGFKVVHKDKRNLWAIENAHGNAMLVIRYSSLVPLIASSCQQLWQLVNDRHHLASVSQAGYEWIENPYFGCKSLEEALIRKDLTA